MTAAGTITEDARAIAEIVAPQSRTTSGHFGPWPWAAPASPEEIANAQSQFAFFDDEVVELLRVTEQFSAGYFATRETLPECLAMSLRATRQLHQLSVETEIAQPFEPTGEVLWFNLQTNPFGVEMGGPEHGRLLAPQLELGLFWRTMAWSLSDAVACTRELYEAGWFQWERNPFYYPDYWHEPAIPQDEMYPTLAPIIDRWNCSPLIAEFDSTYHREPERPS